MSSEEKIPFNIPKRCTSYFDRSTLLGSSVLYFQFTNHVGKLKASTYLGVQMRLLFYGKLDASTYLPT